VYSSFVGDGDSSVHSTIQYVYPGIEVKKIECLNHVIRNFKTKLFDISKNVVKGQDAEKIPLAERKIFNGQFSRFEISVRKAVNYYQDKKNNDSWKELAEDIRNLPMHVFGEHSKCKLYFCKYINSDQVEENLVPQVSKMKFWKPLMQALNRLCTLSKSLVVKETSNKAECFMSIANKFIEGKRKNWGQGYMYRLKMASTVFSFNNSRFWIGKAYRLAYNKEPSDCWQSFENKAETKRGAKKKESMSKCLSTFGGKGDKEYGDNPIRPDMPDDVLEFAIDKLQQSLQVNKAAQDDICEQTSNQAVNPLWFEQRRQRITASLAGTIYNMKSTTDNRCVLNTILGRRQLSNAALDWGKVHEFDAIKSYEDAKGFPRGTVQKSGLIVSLEDGVLGASPDGLIGTDGIIEIKCPYSFRHTVPQDWPLSKNKNTSPIACVDGHFSFKKTHKNYYQVLMQLYVTERKWCDFFVWTPFGYFLERVDRTPETDDTWNLMKEKLVDFWRTDLAPELVDSRFERGYTEY